MLVIFFEKKWCALNFKTATEKLRYLTKIPFQRENKHTRMFLKQLFAIVNPHKISWSVQLAKIYPNSFATFGTCKNKSWEIISITVDSR